MNSERPRNTPPRRRARSARVTRARRRSREGAAALEFALILPLFVFLVLGIIDFGHMLYVVNTITNAAREGARRGVVQQDADDITTAATAGAEAYMDASGIGGSTASAAVNGDDVVVTVTVANYDNITGFSYNLPGLSATELSATRTLSSVSTMRWEFAE